MGSLSSALTIISTLSLSLFSVFTTNMNYMKKGKKSYFVKETYQYSIILNIYWNANFFKNNDSLKQILQLFV